MIVYKIVKSFKNKYLSFNSRIGNEKDIDCCQYNIGEITVPKLSKSKLYAFDTEENAKKYLKTYGRGYEYDLEKNLLFSAEGIGITKHKIRIVHYQGYFYDFWENGNTHLNSFPAPDGTVLCSSIKLLEEIQ